MKTVFCTDDYIYVANYHSKDKGVLSITNYQDITAIIETTFTHEKFKIKSFDDIKKLSEVLELPQGLNVIEIQENLKYNSMSEFEAFDVIEKTYDLLKHKKDDKTKISKAFQELCRLHNIRLRFFDMNYKPTKEEFEQKITTFFQDKFIVKGIDIFDVKVRIDTIDTYKEEENLCELVISIDFTHNGKSFAGGFEIRTNEKQKEFIVEKISVGGYNFSVEDVHVLHKFVALGIVADETMKGHDSYFEIIGKEIVAELGTLRKYMQKLLDLANNFGDIVRHTKGVLKQKSLDEFRNSMVVGSIIKDAESGKSYEFVKFVKLKNNIQKPRGEFIGTSETHHSIKTIIFFEDLKFLLEQPNSQWSITHPEPNK